MALNLASTGRYYNDFTSTSLTDFTTVQGAFSVVSGKLSVAAGGYLRLTGWGNHVNQRNTVTLPNNDWARNYFICARRSGTGDSGDWYGVWYGEDNASSFLYLYRMKAGVGAQLGSVVTVNLAAGDGLRIEVTGTGATVNVKAFTRTGSTWTQRISYDDSSADRITEAGEAYYRQINNNGSGTSVIDVWESLSRDVVTVTGLQTGYYVRLTDGTNNDDAATSSGTATVTPTNSTGFGPWTLKVYNGNPSSGGTLIETSTTTVYGGDTWSNGMIITAHPITTSTYDGFQVSLVSSTDDPLSTIQWQRSTAAGGSTYEDISGATSATYNFTADDVYSGYKYRAAWTNASGTIYSNSAVLTVTLFATDDTLMTAVKWGNAPSTMKVLIVGDSISNNLVSSPPCGLWAEYLESWATTQYPNTEFTFLNVARSGWSWNDWNTQANIDSLIGSFRADIVLYLCGVNDYYLGYSVASMTTNMTGALTKIATASKPSARFIALSLTMLDEARVTGGLTNAALKPYSDAVLSTATSRGYYHADVWDVFDALPSLTDYLVSDGVHPTEAGQVVIYGATTAPFTEVMEDVAGLVMLRWQSDETVSYFASHKVYRNGVLVATCPTPECKALLTGDTAGDVYAVIAYSGSALTGRGLTATSLPCTTVTVDDSDIDAIAIDWSAVSGATTYRVYRRHLQPFDGNTTWDTGQQPNSLLCFSGTNTNYVDTAQPDGDWVYYVEADTVSGTSRSTEARITTARSPYLAPFERSIEGWRTTNGLLGASTFYNFAEASTMWPEQELLYACKNLPAAYERYAEMLSTYMLSRIDADGIPLVTYEGELPDGWIQRGGDWVAHNCFNGSTKVGGWNDTIAHWTFNFATNAHIEGNTSIGTYSGWPFCDLRFGYYIGSTKYTIATFDTVKMRFDGVAREGIITLIRTENSITATLVLTLKFGRMKVAGTIVNNTGSSVSLSLFAEDVSTGGSYTTDGSTSGTGWGIRYHEYTLVSPGFSTFCRQEDITTMGAWSFASSQSTIAFGSVANGGTVSDNLVMIAGGQQQFRGHYGSYLGLSGQVMGAPTAPARVVMGLAIWCSRNPSDTAAKTKSDAFASALYDHRTEMYSPNVELGGLLAYYSIMWAKFGDSIYATRRNALASSAKTLIGSLTDPQEVGFILFGLNEANGQSEDLTSYITTGEGRISTLSATNHGAQFVYYTALRNKLSKLEILSSLLRRSMWVSPTELAFSMTAPSPEASDYFVSNSEAHAQAIHSLALVRSVLGDITPIWIGSDKTNPATGITGSRNDGTITALAYANNTISVTFDKTVQFYMGSRSKPNWVKKGAATLSEHTSDLTLADKQDETYFSTMATDTWHYEAELGVLTIKAVNGSPTAYSFEVNQATGLTLFANGIDNQGCNLSWTVYAGGDYNSYRVYRSETPDAVNNGTLIATKNSYVDTTHHDTTAEAGTNYYYAVVADTTGTDLESNEVEITTAIPDPSIVTLSSGDGSLTWTDNTTAETGIRVEWSVNGGAYLADPSSPFAINTVSRQYNGGNLIGVSSLRGRVQAYNANGDSAWVESNQITLSNFVPQITIF